MDFFKASKIKIDIFLFSFFPVVPSIPPKKKLNKLFNKNKFSGSEVLLPLENQCTTTSNEAAVDISTVLNAYQAIIKCIKEVRYLV